MKRIISLLLTILIITLLLVGCAIKVPTAERRRPAAKTYPKEREPVRQKQTVTPRYQGGYAKGSVVDRLVGKFVFADEKGNWHKTWSNKIIFTKSGNSIQGRGIPVPSVMGIRTGCSVSDVNLEDHKLTFRVRRSADDSWSISEVTADLTGGMEKIPITTKLVDGNVDKIGQTNKGFLIRIGR